VKVLIGSRRKSICKTAKQCVDEKEKHYASDGYADITDARKDVHVHFNSPVLE